MTKGYIETVGRRKTSSARVRISESAQQSFTVNGKDLSTYFSVSELVDIARSPLKLIESKFAISAVVTGGGIRGQAEAIRHGLSRAIIEHDRELRTAVKKAGYLKRDPRAKERRKPGLLKARKAPQWSKR